MRVSRISRPSSSRRSQEKSSLVNSFEKRAKEEGIDKKNIKVAIMGCAVNGPGEAREADIGVAGGDGSALLFKKGEIVRKIKEAEIVDELVREIKLI